MSGDVHTPTNAGPDPAAAVPGDIPGGPQAPGWAPSEEDERPEIVVGAAFVGGVIAAFLLKRLASNDD